MPNINKKPVKHTHRMHEEIGNYVMGRLIEEGISYEVEICLEDEDYTLITTHVSDFPIVDKILDE